MGNYFDQFDEPEKRPSKEQSGNFFDQFDEKPPKPQSPSQIETGPAVSKIGSEFMKTANPWGAAPDWYNAVSDYASKNYIPGPVLQGRGLPKGTEAEKAAALATAMGGGVLPRVGLKVGSAIGGVLAGAHGGHNIADWVQGGLTFETLHRVIDALKGGH
jgi:hypothetical protein